MSLWDIIKKEGKQYLKDAMPGGLLNRELDYEGLRKAGEVTSMTPTPLGDIASGLLAVDDLRNKQYGSAALNSVGLLPFVPGLAGTFIGKGAKTWNQDASQKALQMAKDGIDPRIIWKETGNWKGPDGVWRQEIPDNTAQFNTKYARDMLDAELLGGVPETSAGKLLPHPELAAAYPGIESTRVVPSQNLGSSYQMGRGVELGIPPSGEAKSPLLHELQHAIQEREGWAKGGNLKGMAGETDPLSAYRRLAGEAEARATQARLNMNMEQRLNTFPADSYDIPMDQLIIRNLNGIKRNR